MVPSPNEKFTCYNNVASPTPITHTFLPTTTQASFRLWGAGGGWGDGGSGGDAGYVAW